MSGWRSGAGSDQGAASDYRRDAMRRRRAARWKEWRHGSAIRRWEKLDELGVQALREWALAPLVDVRRVFGRALCGGGGDDLNLGDVAPSGLYPVARAYMQAADDFVNPGREWVLHAFAAHQGGLTPDQVVAFAGSARNGHEKGPARPVVSRSLSARPNPPTTRLSF